MLATVRPFQGDLVKFACVAWHACAVYGLNVWTVWNSRLAEMTLQQRKTRVGRRCGSGKQMRWQSCGLNAVRQLDPGQT